MRFVKKILTMAMLVLGAYLLILGNDAEELNALTIIGLILVGYIIAVSLIREIKK